MEPDETILRRKWLFLLVSALPASSGEAGGGEGTVAVLFDFGNDSWTWADVPLPDPANAWCATVDAAELLDLYLEYSFSQYGVFLEVVGSSRTPDDFSKYWGLWSWDSDDEVWSSSMVGALDLEVHAGDALAWKFGSFGDPPPDPNPLTRYPWLSFRGGTNVHGDVFRDGPSAGGLFWSRDLRNGPIDSTMVVAEQASASNVERTSGGLKSLMTEARHSSPYQCSDVPLIGKVVPPVGPLKDSRPSVKIGSH